VRSDAFISNTSSLKDNIETIYFFPQEKFAECQKFISSHCNASWSLCGGDFAEMSFGGIIKELNSRIAQYFLSTVPKEPIMEGIHVD